MAEVYPQMVEHCKTTIGELPKTPLFVNYSGMENNMPEYHEIGARLKAIRTGFSDLSQKAWAEKHGFNVTQYNNWEKGTRRIPVDAAERISDIYELTLDAIYRGKVGGLSEKARKVF